MLKSISTRFFYTTSILLLCGIAVMGSMQLYLSTQVFRQERISSLENTINITLDILHEYEMGESVAETVESAVSVTQDLILTANATENLLIVTDSDGKILMCNDQRMTQKHMGRDIPARMLNEVFTTGYAAGIGSFYDFFDNAYYYAGKPIYSNTNVLVGYMFAMSDASMLLEYMSSMFSMFILSAGLMLVVSSVLSIWLTARMTTPLRNITHAAKKFGEGNFSVRVAVKGDDEVMQLAQSFNTMADSLEQFDDARSSFMGNIAHELRTPMTTIKGFVDGMLDGTIPPESSEHYLKIVSEEAGRLTRLIKNMLDITKLETNEYSVNAQYYDIWENITGVVFAAGERIANEGITLKGFTPVRTLVYADSDLVYQVIYNLFDNALKFCEGSKEIEFFVIPDKTSVTIRIRNTGEGIAPEALPYVFERFYKEDKSRGLNTMGSGLGLHICKVLVNMSGGKIWAESNYGEDCTFSFTLPRVEKELNKANSNAAKRGGASATSGTKQLPYVSANGKEVSEEQ